MKNLIGKEWLDASNGKVIEITNHTNGELINTIPNSTLEDVDMSVKIAYIA